MMREPWKESLPVQLLECEVLEVAHGLSRAINKRDHIDAKRKHVAKLYKERLDAAEAKIRSLNRTVETGEEYREVLCREEVDLFAKKIRIMRLDTFAIVRERDMERDELQLEIKDAYQATENLRRMEDYDRSPEAASEADKRAAAERAGLSEEQAVALTPDEAEELREKRLAEEAAAREENQAGDEPPPSVAASPLTSQERMEKMTLALNGRDDLAPNPEDEGPF
jgi:hypothetical protein